MKMVVDVLRGALEGISGFLSSLFNVIGGSLNPAAVEGILVLFAISIVYRIFNGGVQIPEIKRRKKVEPEDDEEWVLVRRKKK